MYIGSPLQFSVFPAVLLITTLEPGAVGESTHADNPAAGRRGADRQHLRAASWSAATWWWASPSSSL
ncbi:hypothetical protein ACPA9J_08125 [Pseudomonas aeruginosa]